MSGIDITAGERRIVDGVLRSVLPEGAKIWAFGSRAKGKARAASDLDLAVDAGRALTLEEEGRLAEAFDEAPLAFKVDVVDVWMVSAAFRAIVEGGRVAWDAPL